MASMQFWGVAVKGKEATSVTVDEGSVIHLSQITLSEVKKDNEPVIVHAKVEDNKFVLGILSQNTPQLSCDLVFDSDFEISHNWKTGSIHFLGYKADGADDEGFPYNSSDEEDEEVTVPKENGIVAAPAPAPVASAPKGKALPKPAKDNKPKPVETDDSDEDDSDDEDASDDDDDSDEDMVSKSEDSGDDDDSDEDDDDDDESDEDEKPAKSASGKKRPIADAKTPESKKKAKIVTPQKTDGKKGAAHTATPHPAKKGGKTPGGDKTPKSGGQSSCTPCKKTFNSETALQSHNKAKHAAK